MMIKLQDKALIELSVVGKSCRTGWCDVMQPYTSLSDRFFADMVYFPSVVYIVFIRLFNFYLFVATQWGGTVA